MGHERTHETTGNPSQTTTEKMLWGGAADVPLPLSLSQLWVPLSLTGTVPSTAARAAGTRAPGQAPLRCAPPLRNGLPATASISAVPLAVATRSAARSSQRKAVMRSSSLSPSARSPSSRRRARNCSTSHSCSCTVPGQNSPCVEMTAGRKSGAAVRRPASTCRSTMASRRE